VERDTEKTANFFIPDPSTMVIPFKNCCPTFC